MSSPTDTKRLVGFRVTEEEYRDIRLLCALEGVDYHDLIMPHLRERLKEYQKTHPIAASAGSN